MEIRIEAILRITKLSSLLDRPFCVSADCISEVLMHSTVYAEALFT
jgi:hypothetical protein